MSQVGKPSDSRNAPFARMPQFVQELLGPDAYLFTFLNAFGPTFT
jgi:hypothetical protein